MKFPKALLGLVLGSVCAVPAAAQESGSGVEDGPAFKVTTSALYDSNVARSSAAIAASRGLVRADELYSVLADLNYTHQFGEASAYIAGIAGYDFYQHNSILNRERIDTDAGLKLRFGSCQALLHGNYERHQSDLQDVTLITVTHNTVEVPTLALDARCNRDQGFSPYATVTQTWSYNSSTSLMTSDFRTFLVDAGVAYKQSSLGEIDFFGQYNATDFPKRLFPVGSMLVEDGYVVDGGGLRLNHTFGGKLQAAITLRYTSLSPRLPLEPGFSGLMYEGDLTYEISPRLRLDFTALRATNPSNQVNTTYSIDESYEASLHYKISELLEFGLTARRLSQHYKGVLLTPGVDITSQTIDSINGYLSYDFSRKLSLNLTAGDETRRADVGAFNYDSARVGLSITAAF
jgi:Putative beta-barrel porin 2